MNTHACRLRLMVGLFCLAALPACTTVKLDPRIPPSADVERELLSMKDVHKRPGVPIIDVHTHLFNSRYLPIQGVITSREDDYLSTSARVLALLTTGEWVQPKELEGVGYLLQLATPTSPTQTLVPLAHPESVQKVATLAYDKYRWRRVLSPWKWFNSKDYELSLLRQKTLHNRLIKTLYVKMPTPATMATMSTMSAGAMAHILTIQDLVKQGLMQEVSPAEMRMMMTSPATADEVPSSILDMRTSQRLATSDAMQSADSIYKPSQRGVNRLLHNVERLTGIIEHKDPVSYSALGIAHRHSRTKLESVYWFLLHLLAPENQMLRAMQETENPLVDAFVYQTMQMEPSFQMTSHREPFIYDYRTEQMRRAQELTEQSSGRAFWFVAWNPFVSKDDFNTANPRALETIKQGIKMGAKGVKFYPPMGYRASGNAANKFPAEPSARQNPIAHEQWAGRYVGKDWNGAALDALNDKLFTWCEANAIPILTHCHHGEMRADVGTPNYGELAHPKYWEAVLEKHHRLRLCLGHAGGPEFWEGLVGQTAEDDYRDWGKKVFELCLNYPNVYCDIGIHEEVANPGLGARFVVHLSELVKHPCRDGHHTFADKIMYGTDWFMPTTETPREYLNAYLRVFQTTALSSCYERFFSGNAMRFLGLPVHSVIAHPEPRPKAPH